MIPVINKITPVQTHYLEFLEALKSHQFQGDISPDYANRTVLSTDNSVYQILPQGVVYPFDEHDLVTLAQLADKAEYRDIVLSARGGGTGTNGQSLTDGIVVDLSKHMNKILEINVEENWVRVQTGVVKDQLNAALKAHGLFFAPELSTSNRATIGGMINTDASGQGSCMYGKTRDHVLELKTVLTDGSVIASKPLEDEDLAAICDQQDKVGLIHRLVNNIEKEHKDLIKEIFPPLNRCLTGYDLAHIRDEYGQFNLNNILCGSEGTLGFISEAKLNVLPIPPTSALVIVKYQDFDSSLRDASFLMNALPTSIETIDSKVLNLAMNDFIWLQVEEFFGNDDSDNIQGINLVEYTGNSDEELRSKLNTFEQHLKRDKNTARIDHSIVWGSDNVKKVWAMRKRAVGLLGNVQGESRPIPFVEDTAVPPEHLADFILEFREILDGYRLDYGMFGHVDCGVLHVRPSLDMKNPEHEKMAWEISDRVAELTAQYHGLLWGEHGKGVRSEYSPKFFGELYPQLQRIKSAFDPHNQLNPGKIATPEGDIPLLKIDEVPTRGERDRSIPAKSWKTFNNAVYCNGNGACHNWNPKDAMCPSWKATRQRTQTPKGRASLMREWLTIVNKSANPNLTVKRHGFIKNLNQLPERLKSWRAKRKGEYDFSHEVYDSMAGCLACKSCAGECPIKVNVPEFRSQFLELYHSRYFRPLKDYLVGSLEFLLPTFARAPWLYNFFMNLPPTRWCLEHFVGFVDGPLLSRKSLKGLEKATPAKITRLSEEEKSKVVVIVQDAFTSYFEAELVLDTVALIKELGYTPFLAPYLANGKPLHVHGFLSSFGLVAEQNAKMLNQISELGVPLVGIDPSMTLTYQSEYKKYLCKQKAPEVELLQDWLDNVCKDLPMADENERENKIIETPKSFDLLPHCTESTNAGASVKNWESVFKHFGLNLRTKNVGCCGMSGTFGHEARNKETSKKLYAMSWQTEIENAKTESPVLATGFSCRSQVKREAGQQIAHPIQALLQTLKERG